MLVEVDLGILTVPGEIEMPLGHFPRRMTAVRLAGDRSLVFSAIALREPDMRWIEAIGLAQFPGRAERLPPARRADLEAVIGRRFHATHSHSLGLRPMAVRFSSEYAISASSRSWGKHMRKIIAAAVILSALAPAIAVAQQPGDWVLSRWRGSTHYFPGVVQGRHGDMVNVRFDDGSIDAVPANQIRPYDWRVGSVIECQWTDGNWYSATITAMGNDAVGITVRYEDGVVQQTVTGRCRAT